MSDRTEPLAKGNGVAVADDSSFGHKRPRGASREIAGARPGPSVHATSKNSAPSISDCSPTADQDSTPENSAGPASPCKPTKKRGRKPGTAKTGGRKSATTAMTGREIRAFLAQNSEAVENLARMARGKPIRRYGPGGKTYYSEVDFPTQKWAIGEVVERLAPRLKSAEVTGVDGGPVASETHVHRHGEDNLPPEQLFDRWIQFALRKRQAEQNASAEFASPPGEAARRPGATDAAPQAGAGSGSNGSAPVPAEQLKPGEQIDIDDYAIRLVRDEGGTQDWAVMARGNPRDQQIKRLPNSSEARARQWLDLYLKEQRGEI